MTSSQSFLHILPKAFLGLTFVLICSTNPTSGEITFSFQLDQGGKTSAGIYDSTGKLVRVLWTEQDKTAGSQTGTWDGKDDFGNSSAAGSYQYRVIVNGTKYVNVGAVGNGGPRPDILGHMPSTLEAVAADEQGGIYTANGWDEAGADFKKWDSTGKPVYDAQYQIRNGNPNGLPHALAVDDRYLYCTVGGSETDHDKAAQQVQRFHRIDGKAEPFTKTGREDGHISVYEWPKRQILPGTPEANVALMGEPLRAIAVDGDKLAVADALGGRVLLFDKATGEGKGEFKVQLPQALAVDRSGQLWVGHEHHQLSVFTPDGKKVRDVLGDIGELEGLAIDGDGRVYVADSDKGQVKIYDVKGGAKLVTTLGKKAQPGDRAADCFYRLRGVAVDGVGHIVTIQTEPPVCGARLARWSAKGKLLWEQTSTEFVSLANYNRRNPDVLYSNTFHKYHVTDREKGTWDYVANVFPGAPKYYADVCGTPRALTLGKADFYVLPSGDGVQVYRMDDPAWKLAAMIGGRRPDADGSIEKSNPKFWSWSDPGKTGIPLAADIVHVNPREAPGLTRGTGDPWDADHWFGMKGIHPDQQGGLWFANPATQSIWALPPPTLNAAGNPVYDWKQIKEITREDSSPLKFQPVMAQKAEDGSIYALGMSAPWPSPPNNIFWMGGTTVVRYAKDGHILWAIPLPEVAVGFDVVPPTSGSAGEGEGCIVGLGHAARLLHISSDGLIIGELIPGAPMDGKSGWLDTQASIAINRDPRDKMVDVFAEEDYLLRVAWYRFDDRNIKRLEGTVELK